MHPYGLATLNIKVDFDSLFGVYMYVLLNHELHMHLWELMKDPWDHSAYQFLQNLSNSQYPLQKIIFVEYIFYLPCPKSFVSIKQTSFAPVLNWHC